MAVRAAVSFAVLLVGGGSVLFAVASTLGIALSRGGLHRRPVRRRERVGAAGAEMALTVGADTRTPV
ncbi:hypothetical protein F6J84_09615 [Microbacterium caowuchunii]|uniref:hypothetical protein n=1 Tax=Microbacterium caowuchunii TaxID=2614638 RepID=UPI00124827F3|nr:hypothetical protein [Microbacterium caowuchunii]QEW00321.1 hypothetical protein F6J84_09615 [Microbacterium caowuchunii]